MMNTIVQWATILSPIIAVALAWWTSRRGARDTAKLVKCIKKLTHTQVQLTLLQFHKEFEEAIAHSDLINEKYQKYYGQQFTQFSHLMSGNQLYQEEKKEDVKYKQDLNKKKIEVLTLLFSCLDELNESIEKM